MLGTADQTGRGPVFVGAHPAAQNALIKTGLVNLLAGLDGVGVGVVVGVGVGSSSCSSSRSRSRSRRERARAWWGGGSSYVALQLGPVVPAMDTGKLSRNS